MEQLFETSPLIPPGGGEGFTACEMASWTHFVRVAVERGIERPGQRRRAGETGWADRADVWEAGVLTYRTPVELRVGARVQVPLGRGNTVSGGIVLDFGGAELAGDVPIEKVKGVLRDTGAGLPSSLVQLAKWMAGYYLCPIGMVLSIMMPSAVKNRVGTRRVEMVVRSPNLDSDRVTEVVAAMTPSVRAVWAKIASLPPELLPKRPEQLAGIVGERTVRAINRLVDAGLLCRVQVDESTARGGAPLGDRVETSETPAGLPFEPTRATFSPSRDQLRVIEGIANEVDRFGVHLLRGVTGSGKTEVYLRVIEQLLDADKQSTALVLVPEISLTPQMGGRFEERLGRHGVAVLHSGLSASQRNKQWLRATLGSSPGGARVVVGARSAVFAPIQHVRIIVVDEEHASDYKQDQLPRYHGRDVAIKRGQLEGCPVILGSATPSLESWANAVSSDLSEANPRPNATEGSTSAKAVKYRLWELTERVGGATLPRVEIVDLAEERKAMDARRRAARLGVQLPGHPPVRLPPSLSGKGGLSRMVELGEMIGPTMEDAIAQTLTGGGQVVLLLNRRGYSGYIACADATCGWVLRCDDCDAGLVFHKVIAGREPGEVGGSGRVVRCHHCLAQQLMPPKCPTCGKGLIWLGLGTQRVEEEVAEKFGALVERSLQVSRGGDSRRAGHGKVEHASISDSARHAHHDNDVRTIPPWVFRVDGDTMHSAKDYFDVLGRFARGEIRVLVGTQMIAKGLDFPNVRLVGVINADTSLGLADFRSTERTFQLVSQVAGRAGRSADKPGRVIVQTLEPTSPAIVHAATHDYVGFATEELAIRLRSCLPPITKMARVVVRDEVFEQAMKGAAQIATELRRVAGDAPLNRGGVRILGPMECPIGRIAGFYRVAIEATALRRGVLQDVLARVRERGVLKSDSRTAVDVDPIALL